MSKCLPSVIKSVGSIYVSSCKSIHENLALEEWLFRNLDLEKFGEVALFWSNYPAVVIGRHQNPFLEADVKFVDENGIDFARRHSGGGTVYHGFGNLNISLLTTHKNHCRPRNLQWIAGVINKNLGLNLIATKRDDIIFPDERKVSGTAARIARGRAYHHLTLLINEDLDILRQSLNSPFKNRITTNATQSVPAKHVGQISQEVEGITVDEVKNLLIDSFKTQFERTTVTNINSLSDISFPGINKTQEELLSWEWRFAKTPRFILDNIIQVENGLIKESSNSKYIVGSKFYPISNDIFHHEQEHQQQKSNKTGHLLS
uniref:BPL/LPL catalytic domain-containing protein n=1 Tax=Panagrolaimus davidi TaxID=227884 RepID=A0A914P663_9BILA